MLLLVVVVALVTVVPAIDDIAGSVAVCNSGVAVIEFRVQTEFPRGFRRLRHSLRTVSVCQSCCDIRGFIFVSFTTVQRGSQRMD